MVTRNSGTPARGGGGKGGKGSAPYHSGGSPAPHQAPRGMVAPGRITLQKSFCTCLNFTSSLFTVLLCSLLNTGGARGPGPQMQNMNMGGGLKGQKGAGGMPAPPQKGKMMPRGQPMMPRGQPMMPRGGPPNLQGPGQTMPSGGVGNFQQQAPQQYGGKGMGMQQAPQQFGGKGMGGPPGGPPGHQMKGGPPPNMQQGANIFCRSKALGHIPPPVSSIPIPIPSHHFIPLRASWRATSNKLQTVLEGGEATLDLQGT
jgi:hypothetical protein